MQQINVIKRDGTKEPFDANKINAAILKACDGLPDQVSKVVQVATELQLTLFDGITTEQLDQAVIQTTLQNVKDDPDYDKIAARLLLKTIYKNILGDYETAEELKKLKYLKLRGISSHPGHVYSSICEEDIHKYVLDECETLRKAKELLEKEGYYLKYITSGSTPTFEEAVKDSNINVYHPGNYVFLDSIQLSINKAKIKDCALTVLATIISHPSENLFICDAGAKCLGLDQGAHGNNSIIGYGTVINHPEIIVSSLSEEVGKLKIEGQTNLKIGDKIEIIPNHSCSTANLCSYYTVTEGDNVIKSIKVDVRGNSIKRI